MDLNFMGFTWLPSQVQAANNVFLMVFIVLSNYVLYPAIEKVIHVTALRKISVGLFLAAAGSPFPSGLSHRFSLASSRLSGGRF